MSQRAHQRYAEQARGDLEYAINLIDGLRLKPAPVDEGGADVPAGRFSKAVLLGSEELHRIGMDDAVLNTADVFSLWPIHSKVMSIAGTGESAAVLRSLDTVTVRHTRGRIKRPMPKMLRFSFAHVRADGVGRTAEFFYGVKPGGTLVDITNVNGQVLSDDLAVKQVLAQLVAGIGMYMRYSWSVEIRSVGSNFAVRIPTSAEGARKLLSLRDVEAGFQRRRALRHWVSTHARRRSAEEANKEVSVRAHLRGVTPFRWEDFEGSVRPSDFDLEQNAVRQ